MTRGSGGIFTYQPFKTLFIAGAAVFELVHIPIVALRYTIPALRQYPHYTFRNAFSCFFFSHMLKYQVFLGMTTELSIESGAEGERWTVATPSTKLPSPYQSFLTAPETEIKPGKTGGTWTPSPPAPGSSVAEEKHVVLHFHGGGYVLGAPRGPMLSFGPGNLAAKFGRVFSSGYRMASAAGGLGAFPAPLQDAVTAYAYLVRELGYSGDQIVLAGDSAGGHLALTLSRYLSTVEGHGLPEPFAVLAFSPWVDVKASLEGRPRSGNPLYRTDVLNLEVLYYSAPLFVSGLGREGISWEEKLKRAEDPFVSPVAAPYKSGSKIWVNVGELESIQASSALFACRMAGVPGNQVRLEVELDAPHNTFLLGNMLGFEKSAREQIEKAANFLGE